MPLATAVFLPTPEQRFKGFLGPLMADAHSRLAFKKHKAQRQQERREQREKEQQLQSQQQQRLQLQQQQQQKSAAAAATAAASGAVTEGPPAKETKRKKTKPKAKAGRRKPMDWHQSRYLSPLPLYSMLCSNAILELLSVIISEVATSGCW